MEEWKKASIITYELLLLLLLQFTTWNRYWVWDPLLIHSPGLAPLPPLPLLFLSKFARFRVFEFDGLGDEMEIRGDDPSAAVSQGVFGRYSSFAAKFRSDRYRGL
jgi:hypothetical protein